MRAVVTGASGFLGGAVARALVARGDQVLGLDLVAAPAAPFETVRADLTGPGDWQARIASADLVVHAAARVGELGSPAQFRAQNVDATRHVVDASAEAGRLVHLSSIVVHGRDFPPDCPESHDVQPTGNPYTDTKIAAEHAVFSEVASGRVRATVVRPGDVYGPGSRQWTVRAVEMLRAGRFALVDGDRGVLAPVFVDDVVAGILAAAGGEGAVGEAFHLSGPGVSPRVFFGHYARMTGVRLRSVPPRLARAVAPVVAAGARLVGKEPPLSGRTLEYVTHPAAYSTAKAARVLGWRPAVGLDEGMARTEAWLRETGRLG
ncbi:NAD-dependent epimerase/dehydratase family protein [Rubrivirga sp. IMCC43871]|uniref:NAD-dependent epimerase/dehydratase family protein n=1 Tax=Rubrivirga sp. IMCC43871 TaxID=3391575 RepID=UPI00398FCC0C